VALEAAGTIDVLTGIADVTPQLTTLLGRESARPLVTAVALALIAPALSSSILRLARGLDLMRMPLTLKTHATALPPEPARLRLGGQGKRQGKPERKRNGGEAQGGGGGFHGDLERPDNLSLTPFGVVGFLIDMLTGELLILVEVLALVAGQLSVRLILSLFQTDCALLGAKFLAFDARKSTGTAALRDAIMLTLLTTIDAGITSGGGAIVAALLAIMLLLPDMSVGGILVPAQVGPFVPGQMAIGHVTTLFLTDAPLLRAQAAGLVSGQFAGTHALTNAVLLMVLALIHLMVVVSTSFAGLGAGDPGSGGSNKHHA
jgi:hypothetical protein